MFEVQTYTIIDGWVNVWQSDDAPWTFKTRDDAQEELDEFVADCQDRGMDISKNDYRVKEVSK